MSYKKVLKCNTAGTIAIPSKQSYGEWTFDVYKGDDANLSIWHLMSNVKQPVLIGSSRVGNGYAVLFNKLESFELIKYNNGAPLAISKTSNSYITNNTWYRLKITRTTAGVFTVLIKGGAFTPTAGYDGWTLVDTTGGSGTNPVVDSTYTTSNYFVADLNAGDRLANLKIMDGVKQ